MLKLYSDFLSGLTSKYTIREYTEDFKNVKIIVESDFLRKIDKVLFEKFIDGIWRRDRVRINILEEGYSLVKYSTGDSIEEFIQGLEEDISDEDEKYVIIIEIVKVRYENIIAIYSFNKLVEHLHQLSLKGILYEFNNLLIKDSLILYQMYDEIECCSNSIYIGKNIEINNKNIDIRKDRISKRKEICNFINGSQYGLVPDDFDFVGYQEGEFKVIMDKLKCIMSLISICDISNIVDDNKVDITLNGYKRINTLIDYEEFYKENLTEYYGIYTWIYEDGDMYDRVGIVRNIISLSIMDGDVTKIIDSMEASVRSAHEIYLKENVTQYLDVKEKISEFLFDLTKKTSELADGVGKGFYNNMVALITFYGSIIIMNALDEKKLENIFTKDITIISLIFWGGGVVYMLLSKRETEEEIDRYRKLYFRVKNSYNDILNPQDIERIFKEDIYLKEDEEYIRARSKRYLRCWEILLIALLIGIIVLGRKAVWDFLF